MADKDKFYAVAKGRTPGIYGSWEKCEAEVKGFSEAKFKKFESSSQALDYIVSHGAEQVLRDKLSGEAARCSKK